MSEIPIYPVIRKLEEDTVAKSVAKPGAFSKPGVMGKQQGTRFRSLAAKRAPGRPRTRKRDPRNVRYY